VLLVAIGFFVYSVVITGESYTVVDESRSAVVFSQLTGQIEQAEPEQALGWITSKYEELVGSCGG
jgi:membrane protein required for colicin V production